MWNPITWWKNSEVKKWVSVAFKYVAAIIGSPEAEVFLIAVIAAALGSTPAQVKVVWDILAKLIDIADGMFPDAGTGDKKYAYVAKTAKDEFKNAGIEVSEFHFDYILHNILAQKKARKTKLAKGIKID